MGEKYIGLEILKRHFSRGPVKEVAGNSNFLWLSVNPRVFSIGVNVLQHFPSNTWSVSVSGHLHLLPSFLPVKIVFWRRFLGIWVNKMDLCLCTSVSLQPMKKVSWSCPVMKWCDWQQVWLELAEKPPCLVLFTVLTMGSIFWFLESPTLLESCWNWSFKFFLLEFGFYQTCNCGILEQKEALTFAVYLAPVWLLLHSARVLWTALQTSVSGNGVSMEAPMKFFTTSWSKLSAVTTWQKFKIVLCKRQESCRFLT